jgi:hypothetical protein
MAATQGFLPTSTAADRSSSRASHAGVTVLAGATLIASLAWFITLAGAMSTEQTSPRTFTPYDSSEAGATGSSPYDSLYPAAEGQVAGVISVSAAARGVASSAGEWAANRPGGSVYTSQVPAAVRGASPAFPGTRSAQGD